MALYKAPASPEYNVVTVDGNKETVIPYPKNKIKHIYVTQATTTNSILFDITPLLGIPIATIGISSTTAGLGQGGTSLGSSSFYIRAETETDFTVYNSTGTNYVLIYEV